MEWGCGTRVAAGTGRALEILLGDHDEATRRERHTRETLRETLVQLVKARY